MFKLSNAALITCETDEFVAVHRKENPFLVCLPGGKLDEGENVLQAVIREVFEETGLRIKPEQCIPIHTGICDEGKTYLVTVFLIQVKKQDLVSQEPQMQPCWMNRKTFFEHSAFKKFNEETFSSLDKIKHAFNQNT